MDDLCLLEGKAGLGFVDVALRISILGNFIEGHEGEDLHEPDDILVRCISPVLVIVVDAGHVLIKEDCTLLTLTHLLAVSPHDEVEGKTVALGTLHVVDEVDTCHDVAPLIGSTDLEAASGLFVEHVVVIALKKLVVELNEAQSPLEALLDSFEGQHPVDGEVTSDLAEEPDVVEINKPLGVVHLHCPAETGFGVLGEIDDAAELGGNCLCV